jgi:hypothetical protein
MREGMPSSSSNRYAFRRSHGSHKHAPIYLYIYINPQLHVSEDSMGLHAHGTILDESLHGQPTSSNSCSIDLLNS